MRHRQHRQPGPRADCLEQLQERPHPLGVLPGRRLVENQDAGRADQQGAQCQPLPAALAQFPRTGLLQPAETEEVDGFLDVQHRIGRQRAEPGAESQLADDRFLEQHLVGRLQQQRHLGRVLEDLAGPDRLAPEAHLARSRLGDAHRQRRESALAGAVRADHRDPFALADLEGHVVHRAIGVEVDTDVIPRQDRRAGGGAGAGTPVPSMSAAGNRAAGRSLRQRGGQPAFPRLADGLLDGQRQQAGERARQCVREADDIGHADADASPAGLIGPGHPGRLIEHDPAAIHEHDPVGPRGDLVHAVLDDDDAGALVLGQPPQRAEDFLRAHRVQVRQRLVEHKDPRAHSQRGRDRRALLLAAGQCHGRGAAHPGQPGDIQAPLHPGRDLRLRQGQVLWPERHLRLHSVIDELEIRILEDHADQLGRLVRVQAGQRFAAERDPPAQFAVHASGYQPAQG